MKSALTIIFLFFSFCLKSQTDRSKTENDWILFIQSFNFSESFKAELSSQLKEKLYKLNYLEEHQENPIKLVIGMEDLHQIISNDYTI